MKVAFIGLGAMGLPMALCLSRDAEVQLSLFDLDAERRELARDAGALAASAAAAVADADVIMSVLPADEHVRQIADEIARHGSAGQIYLDFSTIAPQTITDVRLQLDGVGIHTVGLGLLRGTPAAQSGTLVLYAGGLERVRDVVAPLLSHVSAEVIDLGTPEAAKALKVANNMVVGCLDALMCEAIAIGEKAGLSAADVVERLADSGCDSWVLRNHTIPYVLPNDLGPGRFATRLMAKDMRLFGKMAEDYGFPSRLSAVALSYYRGAIAHGHGLDYHPIVVDWLRASIASDEVAPDAGAIDALLAGVAWVQALVSRDALAVTGAAGVDPAVAARQIDEGSGGNESLTAMIAGGEFGRSTFPSGEALDALQQACRAADRLDAPALFFEMAKLDAATWDARQPAFAGRM